MHKALLLLLAAALAGSCADAQSPAPDSYQAMLDRAVTHGVPGVQAVVLHGTTQWSGVAGLASVEQRRPMTASDRIRLASITKMMTYATIMELVKQQRLTLTDRAVDRLPPHTLDGIPHIEQVTIGQLLEHGSGIHNFNGPNGQDFFDVLYSDPRRGTRLWTAPELIAFAKKPSNPPVNAPGERRDYSSTGYLILEQVAEHVSSKPLALLYRQFIWMPLGMRRTGFEGDGLTKVNIVPSYGRPDDRAGPRSAFSGSAPVRDDGLVNLSAGMLYFNAWARGAGAVASTACDLSRFIRAVEANKLTVLSDQAKEFETASLRPKAAFSWNGGAAGIQSSIVYATAQNITVIVLTNGTNVGTSSYDLAQSLLTTARERHAAGTAPAVRPCPVHD